MPIASNGALYTSSALEEHTIQHPDGSDLVWHFTRVSALEWTQYQFAMAGGDEASRARAALRLVMLSIREPDGSLAFTWDQICTLNTSLLSQAMTITQKLQRDQDKAGKP